MHMYTYLPVYAYAYVFACVYAYVFAYVYAYVYKWMIYNGKSYSNGLFGGTRMTEGTVPYQFTSHVSVSKVSSEAKKIR